MFKRKIKAAKKDFTPDMLPSSRKEVFFDIIKTRFTDILKLGGFILLFCLPILAVEFFSQMIATDYYRQFESGKITKDVVLGLISSLSNFTNLALIPCFIILSIAFCGAFRLLKRLVWAESIDFAPDFALGIKSNFKHFAIVFLIIGILNFVINYSLNILMLTNAQTAVKVATALSLALAAALSPTIIFMMSITTIYSLPFKNTIKNSFILYMKTAPKTFLLMLLSFIPFLLLLIPNIILQLSSILLLSLGCPFVLTIWILYSCKIFDKFINNEFYPDIVNKGFFPQ